MIEILIAEDSQTQAAHLKHILEKHGYKASVARNGSEALASLAEHQPAIIVSDVMMPEMDGYQLCRRIKEDPALKDIPVVLLTALGDPEDIIKGVECGADNFIVKPYEEQALVSRIRNIVSNRELRGRDHADHGLEVYFAGRKHVVTSLRVQIVDLLLSAYETSVQKSRDLIEAQDKLRALNELTVRKNQELVSARDELRTLNARLEEKLAELTLANSERERLLLAEQESRRAAEAAVRARDEFMSVAAHELKTPITSLRGYAQLLLRQLERQGDPDPARVRTGMLQIERQSTRLASLVNQLLDLSRLEAGKLVLSRSETDLPELVEGVLSTLQSIHPQRNFVLTMPEQLFVEIDSLRLEQVITNLLDNAVKFSPPGSPVEVTVERTGQDIVRIAVRDHGRGIPPETCASIFERFYQADDDEWHGGMGLGLFISRQIVQLHGGNIDVECPSDGGTRFTVSLPDGRDLSEAGEPYPLADSRDEATSRS